MDVFFGFLLFLEINCFVLGLILFRSRGLEMVIVRVLMGAVIMIESIAVVSILVFYLIILALFSLMVAFKVSLLMVVCKNKKINFVLYKE